MSGKEFILKFILRKPFNFQVIGNIILGFASGLFNGVNTTLIVPILLQISGQEIELKGSPRIIQFPEKLFTPKFEKILSQGFSYSLLVNI